MSRKAGSSKVNQVLAFIIKFKEANDGISPTYREIMDATQIKTTSTVNYYISRLEREGHIRLIGVVGTSRGIAVNGGQWSKKP